MNQESHCRKTQFKNMPIYTCSCGAQILILPNLLEMNREIRYHIAEHRRRTGQLITEEVLSDEILTVLSQFFL